MKQDSNREIFVKNEKILKIVHLDDFQRRITSNSSSRSCSIALIDGIGLHGESREIDREMQNAEEREGERYIDRGTIRRKRQLPPLLR